jgi:hypothetical protein
VLCSFDRAIFWQDKKNHEENTLWYCQGIFRSIGGKSPVKTYRGSILLSLYFPYDNTKNTSGKEKKAPGG